MQEFPSVRGLLLALAALLTFSGAIGLFAALSYKETKRALPGNQRISIDHIFNGTFNVARTGLSWVSEGLPKLATFVIMELTGNFYFLTKPETVFSLLRKTVS